MVQQNASLTGNARLTQGHGRPRPPETALPAWMTSILLMRIFLPALGPFMILQRKRLRLFWLTMLSRMSRVPLHAPSSKLRLVVSLRGDFHFHT